MWSGREKIELRNGYLGFSINKKSKLIFWKISIFLFSIKKNVIYVWEHYIVHVHTKFHADIIFCSHPKALKIYWPPDGSMVPTHSDLAFGITTSSTSVYALASLSCKWILLLSKVLVMYLFKYIWYFAIQTIGRIFVVERKIDHWWPDLDYITYALIHDNCEIHTWDQL